MVQVNLKSAREIAKIAAHDERVQEELTKTANTGVAIAKRKLETHRNSGITSISVEHGGVDAFIVMKGINPTAFEFGHINSGIYEYLAPKRVTGKKVLTETKHEMGL